MVFFWFFFFHISFLSMFLVPWHFLPRTIFILDWLEQASCAYIYVPFLIILPCCTLILVDCLSSLEYPLISYGDFIVLFVIIVHVYMYKFWCTGMCLKGFICSVHKSWYSISFNGTSVIDVLFLPFTCILVNHHFRISYETWHVPNLTTYIQCIEHDS